MRSLIALVALAIGFASVPGAASAQDMPLTAAALKRHFPASYAALEPEGGAGPTTTRRAVSEAMVRFQDAHGKDIVAAPGPLLIALEADHARMLRALGRQDVQLCAVVGDRGFFGKEAMDGTAPPGLDDYGAALVEAAAAGAGRSVPARPQDSDLSDWLAAIERREPAVPVGEFLASADLRKAASASDLCAGAAVMHEAIADLAPDSAARMAALLVGALVLADEGR